MSFAQRLKQALKSCWPYSARKKSGHAQEAQNKMPPPGTDKFPDPLPEEYPTYPPAKPHEILANRAHWMAVVRKRGFYGPKGDEEDRPLYGLYRLYECLLLDYNIGIRNALESFWMHDDWPVSEIPDPGSEIGQDHQTYAVMACAVLLMLESFNEKIESGLPRDTPSIVSWEEVEEIRSRTTKVYETEPAWVSKVAPLPQPLIIPDEDGNVAKGDDDPKTSPQCLQKNVYVVQPHIYFR